MQLYTWYIHLASNWLGDYRIQLFEIFYYPETKLKVYVL